MLLSILAVNSAGFYIYYVLQLRQIHAEKREQIKRLPDDALQILKLTASEYQKARVDEHEVKVDGKMYDISRVEIKDNSVWVYCLHDADEDNLIALLAKVISVPLKDKSSMPVSILQFLSLSFITSNHTIDFYNSSKIVVPKTGYQLPLSTYVQSINLPPPRVS